MQPAINIISIIVTSHECYGNWNVSSTARPGLHQKHRSPAFTDPVTGGFPHMACIILIHVSWHVKTYIESRFANIIITEYWPFCPWPTRQRPFFINPRSYHSLSYSHVFWFHTVIRCLVEDVHVVNTLRPRQKAAIFSGRHIQMFCILIKI